MKLMFPKRFVFSIAALLALSFLAAAPLRAADAKIGLVDLRKIFDGYYKTKQADVQLKERVADSEKVMKGMVDDYQKAQDDYKKLIDSSNDQAVSAEEREKRKKNAEAKLTELQDIERSVRQFRTTTQTALEEQSGRMREEILTYLKGVIATQARKANYTHVFDSRRKRNQTPILLYTTGMNDFTDNVPRRDQRQRPRRNRQSRTQIRRQTTAPEINPDAKNTKDKTGKDKK